MQGWICSSPSPRDTYIFNNGWYIEYVVCSYFGNTVKFRRLCMGKFDWTPKQSDNVSKILIKGWTPSEGGIFKSKDKEEMSKHKCGFQNTNLGFKIWILLFWGFSWVLSQKQMCFSKYKCVLLKPKFVFWNTHLFLTQNPREPQKQ